MKLVQGNLKRWRKQHWAHWDHGQTREMCGEKVIYKTFQEVEFARKEQELKWSIQLRAYNDCEHCDFWHLTSEV